jgi:hypothetical protein
MVKNIYLYFLFEFVNLYYRFDIYRNCTTTAVGHGGCRVTTVPWRMVAETDSRTPRRLPCNHRDPRRLGGLHGG